MCVPPNGDAWPEGAVVIPVELEHIRFAQCSASDSPHSPGGVMKRAVLLFLFGVVVVGSGLVALRASGKYGSAPRPDRRVHREFAPAGQLTKLVYDLNGNFKPDSTSYFS